MSDLEHDTTIRISADGTVTISTDQDRSTLGGQTGYIYITDQCGDDILKIEIEANKIVREVSSGR